MASPQWLILSAVKAALEGSAGFSGVTVKIRERPYHSSDHGDPPTLVTVSPEAEDLLSCFMPDGMEVAWPVVVAIFQPKDGVVQDAAAAQARVAYRWAALQALGVPRLSGASTVFNFAYDAKPFVDLGGLDQAMKVSLQRFTYKSKETRGGSG